MANIRRSVFITALLSLAVSGCLGETNQHLTGMEKSTQTLATEVQKDRELLKAAVDQAAQTNATLTRTASSLEGTVARIDTMNANLTSISGSVGSMTKSVDSVAQSVSVLPPAMAQLNESTKTVGAAASATEEQAKRIGDNLAVLDAYAAVALKAMKDQVDKQNAAAAAAQAQPPAQAVAVAPAPAAGGPLAAPTDDDWNRLGPSLLGEGPKPEK